MPTPLPNRKAISQKIGGSTSSRPLQDLQVNFAIGSGSITHEKHSRDKFEKCQNPLMLHVPANENS
jgi:hypothetical protein